MSLHAVSLIDVRAGYGDVEVLRSVSCVFTQRRTTAIIGPGGSGKSTLLRLICSQEAAGGRLWRTGEVRTHGLRTTLVTQFPRSSAQTLAEVIAARLPTQDPRSAVERFWAGETASAAAELGRFLETPLRACPVGVARLAEFMVIAVDQEPVLCVDEPECGTGAASAWIWAKLATMRGERTVVVVTHNLESARRYSDDLVFLLDGELIESGETAAVFQNPEKARTREMIRWGA